MGAGTQPVTPGQAAHCKILLAARSCAGVSGTDVHAANLPAVERTQARQGGVISKPSCLAANGDLQGKCCCFCMPEVAGLCPLEGRVAAAKGPRARGE